VLLGLGVVALFGWWLIAPAPRPLTMQSAPAPEAKAPPALSPVRTARTETEQSKLTDEIAQLSSERQRLQEEMRGLAHANRVAAEKARTELAQIQQELERAREQRRVEQASWQAAAAQARAEIAALQNERERVRASLRPVPAIPAEDRRIARNREALAQALAHVSAADFRPATRTPRTTPPVSVRPPVRVVTPCPPSYRPRRVW
jgi:hypothetical protein